MDARTIDVIARLVDVMLKSGIDENLVGQLMDDMEAEAKSQKNAGHPVDAAECQKLADAIEAVIKSQ